MLRFNNKLIRLNGSLAEYTAPPGPEPEPFVQYNYTTFKARTTTEEDEQIKSYLLSQGT